MSAALTQWSYDDIRSWGDGPHRAAHRLHESDAWDDTALAALLDRVPRSIVHPYTMGTDPVRTDEWQRGELTELPGAELLDIVRRGRLWLNVVGIGDHDPQTGRLARELYEEIAALAPGFVPQSVKSTLLISSPSAMVYYHADNQPNALWQLRGRKRLWVYPRGPRFVSAEHLEAVVAGVSDEQLPYRRELDDHADVIDLAPGEVAWWPQNSPHRVENVEGLNVSLSTEHRTAASTRREQLVASNHFARNTLRMPRPSEAEHGIAANGKITLSRIHRKVTRREVAPGPATSFAVDPTATDGVRAL